MIKEVKKLMFRIRSYYLAKILFKLHLSSFYRCNIDSTANISANCVYTKVKMGRYSYSGANTNIADAEIGSFCSIGGEVRIGGGIHPMNTVSMSPVFLDGRNFLHKNFAEIPYEPSSTVKIGNDVWIGQGAYIKAGITIGDGVVIGAHSVVTHDIEPYTVVAGVPAKTLYKRFDDKTIEKLLDLKWWNWSVAKLSEYGKFFETPEILIKALEEKEI